MALENLKESFGDAFTPELQQELENKIDNLVESRAQVIADEKAQNAKTELDTKCEEFKSKLEEESKSIVNENLNKLNDTINNYVDRVVDDFVNEHLDTFTANEDELKNTAIRESVSNACKIAGVTLSMIDEGISEQGIATERENKLKEQLTETQNENFELKRKLTESYKMGVISELSYDLNEDAQKKFERIASDIEFSKDRAYVDKLKSIKESLVENDPSALVSSKEDELNESLENANKQIKELKATNENLIQMGTINELGSDLNESSRAIFERKASRVEVRSNADYFNELKSIKESLVENDPSALVSSKEDELNESLENANKQIKELKATNENLIQMGTINELGSDLNESSRAIFERKASRVEVRSNADYFNELKSIKESLVENDPSALVSSKEDELNESLENANKQIKELKATNEKLIQMGIVNELKCNLSESDARHFERKASRIRYTNAKDYLNEMRNLREEYNNCSEEKEECLDKIDELETKVNDLQTENKALKKKNDKLIQQGVINELKEGLTIVEAEKFEKLANNIPFAKNEDYFNKLNELKKTVCEHQSEVRETKVEKASVNESLSDLLVEGLNSLDKTVEKKPVYSLQDMLNGL